MANDLHRNNRFVYFEEKLIQRKIIYNTDQIIRLIDKYVIIIKQSNHNLYLYISFVYND